jgi:hypothetical protein
MDHDEARSFDQSDIAAEWLPEGPGLIAPP